MYFNASIIHSLVQSKIGKIPKLTFDCNCKLFYSPRTEADSLYGAHIQTFVLMMAKMVYVGNIPERLRSYLATGWQ